MSKNSKKVINTSKKRNSEAEKKRLSKIIVFTLLAAVLLAAAVLIVIKLVGDKDDSPETPKDALNVTTLTECFAKLKNEGKIATYYTYNDADLIFEEQKLLSGGIEVSIKRGCFAKMIDDEIIAYEFETKEQAEEALSYYEGVLVENYRAVLVNETVVFGTEAMLDLVLPNFTSV